MSWLEPAINSAAYSVPGSNASSVSSLKRAFRRQSTANYSSGFKSESVSNLSGLQRMRSVRGLGQNNDSVGSASKGFFKGLRRLSTMNYSTHGDVRQVSDSVSSLSRFLRRQSTLNSNSLAHVENFREKNNKRVMIDKEEDDENDEARVATAHTNKHNFNRFDKKINRIESHKF